MPGSKYAPHQGQLSTHFQLSVNAHHCDEDVKDLQDRIEELALRQDFRVTPGWIDTAEFVLADRSQVESVQWCAEVRAGVCIRCVGRDTARFKYGFAPSENVPTPDVPVAWDNPVRDARLKQALWMTVEALSQGRSVIVHCEQSFHRGPAGLMALLKSTFDIPAHLTKAMILAHRIVWDG